MRAYVVAACLLLTAFMFVPAASAAVDPLHGCTGKPGQYQVCREVDRSGACAGVAFGLQGSVACAGPHGGKVCAGFQCVYTTDPTDAVAQCIGQPGAVAVCSYIGTDTYCASAGFGLQGASACNDPEGTDVCVGFQCRHIPVTV